MHCEQAQAALLDDPDRPASEHAVALAEHLESCAECRALQNDVLTMQSRARVWHELGAPPWNPDPRPWQAGAGPRLPWWQNVVQQWLPLAASTAALLLAVSVYRQQAPVPEKAPEALIASGPAAAPAGAAAIAASRRERQQEMEALTTLIKAELDRQELETEQSLKYIIAHQIQSQRDLEDMRGRLLKTAGAGPEQM